ncbi:hypothetical protein [Haloarcula sp. CGMCC 1.6347]|uniref:hypothetical protein n=1 Tax=Haloarcula sp. CGMCC 1.6347 TaxID=3111455 RepID=UPI00300E8ED1
MYKAAKRTAEFFETWPADGDIQLIDSLAVVLKGLRKLLGMTLMMLHRGNGICELDFSKKYRLG